MNSKWYTTLPVVVLLTLSMSACGLVPSTAPADVDLPEVTATTPTPATGDVVATTVNPAFAALAQGTSTEAVTVTGNVLELAAVRLAEGSEAGIDSESIWYAVAAELGDDIRVLTSTGALVADSVERHEFFQVERTFAEAVCVSRIVVSPSPSPSVDDVGGAQIGDAVCR
jgi:hypothetical protein